MLVEKRRYAQGECGFLAAGKQHVAVVAKLAKVARVPFASLVPKAATPYEGIVAGRESAMSSSSPRTAGAAYRG